MFQHNAQDTYHLRRHRARSVILTNDELVEMRAAQRTFEGAYIRTALGQFSFSLYEPPPSQTAHTALTRYTQGHPQDLHRRILLHRRAIRDLRRRYPADQFAEKTAGQQAVLCGGGRGWAA